MYSRTASVTVRLFSYNLLTELFIKVNDYICFVGFIRIFLTICVADVIRSGIWQTILLINEVAKTWLSCLILLLRTQKLGFKLLKCSIYVWF